MKRIALFTLLLAPVVLSGCQTVKSHNPFRHRPLPYLSAPQEQPLKVPAGVDQPPTTEALAIPDAATAAPASATSAAETALSSTPPPLNTANATTGTGTGGGLTLADKPGEVYSKVGQTLAQAKLGQVTAHDDAARTYRVAVDTVVVSKPKGGFFYRLFHRKHTEVVKGPVLVKVAPSGTGSLVEASGDTAAVARVMAVLQKGLQ